MQCINKYIKQQFGVWKLLSDYNIHITPIGT